MFGILTDLDPANNCDLKTESGANAYNMLFLLTGLAVAMFAFAKFAESKNRLNYDDRSARIIAGFIAIMVNLFHAKKGDVEITDAENKLIAVGPHRTSLDGFVVASKIDKTPPRFFATTSFNALPGISSLLSMFKVIPVIANEITKGDGGQSANASSIDDASKILKEGGCVVIFPQGNFSRKGQEPPRVYTGAAKIALKNQIPIQVIRLDGFWSLENSLIPVVIRNSLYYRAFFSLFHLNNVRTTLCCEIDFHLKPENAALTDEQKIEEICAQLYAYYRHTKELTVDQLGAIKTQIADKTHTLFWSNKVKQDHLGKQLLKLKQEEAELDAVRSLNPHF